MTEKAFVDDAAHLIKARAARPVIVVGQSIGGMVAMLLASSCPVLVVDSFWLKQGFGP